MKCPKRRRALAGLALTLCGITVPPAHAATFEIHAPGPGTGCDEEFERVANALQPGDELILHDGEYTQSCRRQITVRGTADKPILIRAADGAAPLLTRPADDLDDNNIEITGEHVTLRGLRFRGGSIGVRFFAGHHVTFEDNEVFATATTAVTMNSGDTDAFVIRDNHIHHSGRVGDNTEGEGLYVGCHDGGCVASSHLIEGNHIHHLRGTSAGGNDGIELKYRSFGNVVRGNEIHDTNIGRAFPCVFSYGGGDGPPNVVENNLLYRCGEAILVTADTIVRNNVVLDSSSHGIHARVQQPSMTVRNVSIVNNTVAGTHPVCAQLRWRDGTNLTFANNALLCPLGVALRADGLGDATLGRNAVAGRVSGVGIDGRSVFRVNLRKRLFVASAQRDFRLATGAALIDAGDSSVNGLSKLDFDGRGRVSGAAIDVGAFEWRPAADRGEMANDDQVGRDKGLSPVPGQPESAGGSGGVTPLALAALGLLRWRRRNTAGGKCLWPAAGNH